MLKTTGSKALFLLLLAVAAAIGIRRWISSEEDPRVFATWTSIPLKNGPNEIDIDNDGRQDLVFVAWRDNANAHGYDRVTFYRHSKAADAKWQIVPFDDGADQTDGDSFQAKNGADCQLRGIALVRNPSESDAANVVIGEREFGQSYADPAGVKFVVYRIALNDGVPGSAPVFFQRDRVIEGKSKYCDINEAFTSELGIHIEK